MREAVLSVAWRGLPFTLVPSSVVCEKIAVAVKGSPSLPQIMNSSTTTMFAEIMKSLATQSPVILVCLVGCIVVLVRWRALRSAAIPGLLGFGSAMLLSLASPLIWIVLPRALQEKWSDAMPAIYTALGVGMSVCWALIIVLFMLGIALGRSQPPSRNP